MTERDRVIRICRDLNLPSNQYVVNGSGAMIMQGITAEQRGKPMGDLDVFCATRAWFDLLFGHHGVLSAGASGRPHDSKDIWWGVPTKVHWGLFTTDPNDPETRVDPPYLFATMYGLEVNIFFEWRRRARGNFNLSFYIHNAKIVDGVPCAWLQWIYDWKSEVGRAKDQIDIEVLRQYPTEVAPEVPRL